MKILVAEDNAVTATLMTGVLTRQGYTVVLARNGTEALSLLRSHPDIQGVITDIMMPESSGLDLLRALRGHAAWNNLPTIVTTVRDDRETVAEAVSLGCKEYLLKPVRPARLIERVTKVFRQEKVILMSSAEVISHYSISPETYRKIAENFAIQVDHTLAALQAWPADYANAASVDFIAIMEGATLLGAERLAAALEEISPAAGSPSLSRLQGSHLVEELQRVHKALSDQIG
jgi:DNA-binding response OmpR family regulator